MFQKNTKHSYIRLLGNSLYLYFSLIRLVQTELGPTKGREIYFFFYNGNSTEEKLLLDENSKESIMRTGIKERSQLKIVIHGVNAGCTIGTVPVIVSGYLEENYRNLANNNVICVDYGPLVEIVDVALYGIGIVEIIGHHVAKAAMKLIKVLLELQVIESLDDIHIVAHSMGSQVAGIIGRRTQLELGGSLGRISGAFLQQFSLLNLVKGLDPANTFQLDFNNQLDRNDAKFVDIIHTSAGYFGSSANSGHVDFYPDGGTLQNACRNQEYSFLKITEILCSHTIAGKYWKQFIFHPIKACKAESWNGFRNSDVCNSQVAIGEYTSRTARGKYFLQIPEGYVKI